MALRMTENHTELSFRYMRIEGRKEKLLDFLSVNFVILTARSGSKTSVKND